MKWIDVTDLLKKFLLWFSEQSNQRILQKTRKEFQGPGVRVQQLERRTQRAVRTWLARYYNLGFNIQIGLDDLRYIDGVLPVRKQNKLSTHLISVVKVGYDNPAKIVLVNKEAVLAPAYIESPRDDSGPIIDTLAKLLAAQRIQPGYWQKHHSDIDLTEKRLCETAIAMSLSLSRAQTAFPRITRQAYDLVEELLLNPDIPKELLYPPDVLGWEELITLIARIWFSRRNHLVFPDLATPGEERSRAANPSGLERPPSQPWLEE